MISARIYHSILITIIFIFAAINVSANTPYSTGTYSGTYHNCAWLPTHSGNGTWSFLYTPSCPNPPSDTVTMVGLHSTTADGASAISGGSSPTTSEHEIIATLRLKNTGALAAVYVSARPNTWLKTTGYPTGSGYAVTMQYLSGNINDVFTAAVRIWRIQNNEAASLAYFTISTTADATLRAVRTNLGGTWKILAYVNGNYLGSAIDSTFTTYPSSPPSSTRGPGFGIRAATADTYVTKVTYHAIEHGTPDNGQLDSGLSYVVAPAYAAFQWNPVSDSAGGSPYGASGVSHYELYRNGALRTMVKHHGGPMSYTDTGLTPSTNYTYVLRAVDFHGNSTEVSRAVTTPAGFSGVISTLPRQVGLPVSASTWGSAGESIDLLSGNVHHTYPLLTATGRGGYSVPLVLSYDAQNWMEESSVVSHFGSNRGAGYGWKIQFGSIRAVTTGYAITHYVYEDGTGAQYPLDVLSGMLWRPSGFAPVLEYDAATNRLWFKDGSFWQMDCVSSSGEGDAGTRYPTLMQDVQGNQIYIRYRTGLGAGWPNSSARIAEIEDVEALTGGGVRYTYKFDYLSDGGLVEKLYTITRRNNTGKTLRIDFTLSTGTVTLASPISGTNMGIVTRYLTKVERIGSGATTFAYVSNNAGELNTVTLPHGGSFGYVYGNATYSGKTIRQVTSRVLTPMPGGSSHTYSFSRTGSGPIPATTRVIDASNASDKVWSFNTSSASVSYGLWTQLDERALPSMSVKRRQVPVYNSHSPAKVFIESVTTTMDPGTGNAISGKHAQWLDEYGNLQYAYRYSYTDHTNPAQTLKYTYAHYSDSTYATYRRFNYPTKAELKNGGSWITLQQMSYAVALASGASCAPYPENYDTSGWHCDSTLSFRRNLSTVTAGGLTTNFQYDYRGNMVRTWGAAPEVTSSFSGTTNFAMPDIITPNSTGYLATSFTYDADQRPAATTAPNSAVTSTSYDTYGRVESKSFASGGAVLYTYTTGSGTSNILERSRVSSSQYAFTRSRLDGLGRVIKTESGGHDMAIKTVTETEYEPCACSPTGKVKRTSLPYAPGGTVQWTTYTYDALGRTLSVALPGGAGTTTYEYVKNTVKVTDPAGKWKTYETNGLGQLVKVIEPNPAGGANLETTYAYNVRGQLYTATMTRGGTTQVRTFNYDLATGRLTSAVKPETGTTSYTYNSDGTVQHTVDAKNQRTSFTYDALKRVTSVKRYTWNGSSYVHQACQDVDYYYDQNPDTSSNYNLRGRLAKVTAKQCDTVVNSYSETYEYEVSGLLNHRDSEWTRLGVKLTRRVDPQWNAAGRMESFGYGTAGSLYSYAYTQDNMGRPTTMTGESLTLVDNISFNAAGAMTAFRRRESASITVNNTYTFNDLYQLTNQTVVKGGTTLQNLTYTFSATQNNGQIVSQTDALSGETVEYEYDALNRLISAATPGGGGWGLSFSYDGFGNRTNQSVTKGSGPTHSVTINAANNRISTSGYVYDTNGNMTQMPQLTMVYDVANRMVESNHASAGTHYYGYNQSNQRVFERKGTAVTYYLYGMGGERLMEMKETCSGSCTAYTEAQRWIYFAGRKMFSKTGSTLKAVTPNRLASEAKHYPYGETQGTPPSDTKDYFATYRRDDTGLDYAWNRYYSSTMGRFTTADPYGGSAKLTVPQSWNRYSYVENNPTSYYDPSGTTSSSPSGPTFSMTVTEYGVIGDILICVQNPHLTFSLFGWQCNPSTSIYSFEMLSILVPAYLQNMPVSQSGGSTQPPSLEERLAELSSLSTESCSFVEVASLQCGDSDTVGVSAGGATMSRLPIPLPARIGMAAWWVLAKIAGERGEAAVRQIVNLPKNTQSIFINGVTRIPDIWNVPNKIIIEVKNIQGTVNYTKQIADMAVWSVKNNHTLQLWVNDSAQISPALQHAHNAGFVQIIRYTPLP